MQKVNEILEFSLFTIRDHSFTVFNLTVLIIIFLVVRITMWTFQILIKKRLEKRKVFSEGRMVSVLQLVKYLVYIIAFVVALESVGVDIQFLLVSSAALLVGVGFGMQEIFKDVLSGIIILFEANIRVGDVIELERESLIGTIREINLRTCEVETRDSTYVIVPNSQFVNDQVINWSHNFKKTRFNITVGVAYGSDIALVKEVLLQCAKDHKDVMDHPDPFVNFINFGNSSLDFKLLFWSRRIWESEMLKSEIRYLIAEAFKKNNIQIPFPQMDLHLKSDDTK